MTPEDFAPLEISRYELHLRAEEACTLPPFLGSTLRGAFGHALRKAAYQIDGCDCNGCSAADPCAYHYVFETPAPPDVPQLRGQREAPVPFILSPPIVQNPVNRVWRVPAVQSASAAKCSSHESRSSILNPRSSGPLSVSAEPGGFARNSSNAQSAIRNPQSKGPQSAISSVVFPDRPRRFAAGDTLAFDLVLIGRAIEYLRYVVLAVDKMARRGLGATRARFELKEVWLKGAAGSSERIWANGAFLEAQPFLRAQALLGAQASRLQTGEGSRLVQIARPLSGLIRERLAELKSAPPPEENSSCPPSLEEAIAACVAELANTLSSEPLTTEHRPPATCRLRLRFFTPARIRVQGDLQTDLSFELLARNLLRRVSSLAAVHGRGPIEVDYRGLIDRAKSVVTVGSQLRWWDLERYTNRQEEKLMVGGFIGAVEYEGEAIAKFLPLLVAGELLGIGTGTSFGLGSYRILEHANTTHGNVGMVQTQPTYE